MATITADLPQRTGLRVRLQAWSGLMVALFVGVHLLNTFMLAISFTAYDAVQASARQVYQQPLMELALLLALAVHMACGLLGMLARRSGDARPVPWRALPARLRWQRAAGVFLLLVVAGHVLATRGVSFWFGVFPGAEGLGFTMAFVPAYFYPYYFLLGLAGFVHGALGVQSALARLGGRAPRLAMLPWATAGVAVLLALSLSGAGGLLYATPDPFANDFARLLLGMLGAVR